MVDIFYYRNIISTQNDPEILKLEMHDLLNELEEERKENIPLEAEVIEKTAEELTLRRLLWLRHGCKTYELYGDDGEMQCTKCMIDFKRDTAVQIENKWNELILLRLKTSADIQQELKRLSDDSRFSE
jgi:hypothetical protein